MLASEVWVMEAASSRASKILSGVRVVVVEYHDYMRALVAEFLSQHGAKVIACASASEGLEAMKQNRADVILSELNLPCEDGFQFLRSVRRLRPGPSGNTRAIAMNSLGCSILRKRALSEGFDGYLDKPFTPKTLIEAIHSVLGLNRFQPRTLEFQALRRQSSCVAFDEGERRDFTKVSHHLKGKKGLKNG